MTSKHQITNHSHHLIAYRANQSCRIKHSQVMNIIPTAACGKEEREHNAAQGEDNVLCPGAPSVRSQTAGDWPLCDNVDELHTA
jgi:hypothetical protein